MMKTFLLMSIQLTLDKPIIFRNIFAVAVQSWCLTHLMNMTMSSRTHNITLLQLRLLEYYVTYCINRRMADNIFTVQDHPLIYTKSQLTWSIFISIC